jgi:hypothetical protein
VKEISLAAYALIALMGVMILPRWSAFPYDIPRQTLICVGGFALLAVTVLIGPIGLIGPIFLLWPMFAWWILATLLSKRPEISAETAIQFFFCAVVGILAGSTNISNFKFEILIALSGTICALYAILQRHFHVNLFKGVETARRWDACGFTRNTNFTGPWLVLTSIFTASLIEISNFKFEMFGLTLCLAVQLWAILIGRCRTAWVGLAAGYCYLGLTDATRLAYVGPLALLVLVFAFINRLKVWNFATLRERRAFLRIFWEGFRNAPLIGYGFNVIKTRAPHLQRTINEKTGGKFLKAENYLDPCMRKVHNDLLQHSLDVGLIGATITICSLYFGITHTAPFAIAVIIAFIAMGLTFHSSYWLPTQCLFWLAWGSMAGPVSIPNIGPIGLIGLILLGVVASATSIRTQIFDVLAWRWHQSNPKKNMLIKSAIETRENSIYLFHGANQLAVDNRIPESAEWLHRALDRFDGDTRIWLILSCLGELYLLSGSLALAKYYHEQALSFNPEFKHSAARLEWLKKVKTVSIKGGNPS